MLKSLWAKLKRSYRSRTIMLAAALGAFGAVQVALPSFSVALSPTAYGWLSIAVGIAVAWLRLATTKPLEDR